MLRCEPTTVPEAPVVSDIPDLDSLLGCGDNTLLELRPSQWLPETQKQQKLPLTDIKNIYTINSHTSKFFLFLYLIAILCTIEH